MNKRIKDIYHPGVHSVSPDDAVVKALDMMREHADSCVVVLERNYPVGIFTERDVVRCIANQGLDFTGKSIGEVMTTNVITVTPEQYIFDTFNILSENKIRHLVVVDDQHAAIGVATQTDLVEHFGYDYFIRVKTVDQIMNKGLCTVAQESSLREAALRMAEQRVSFLIVGDWDKPAGLLTERDLARWVSLGNDIDATQVSAIMSSPVRTILDGEPAYHANDIMREHNIRRLVVVDKKGRAIGVVTQTDMVRGLESKYIEMLKQIINEQGKELDQTVQMLAKKTLYLDSILSTSINMGIIATDDAMNITYFNPAAEHIFGIPASHALGLNIWKIHELEQVAPQRLSRALSRLEQQNSYAFSFVRNKTPETSEKHISARLSGIKNSDKNIGYVLILDDVTEKKKAEETITRLAYYDVLTDIPNRAFFNERLASEFAHGRRGARNFGVILMDVDGFKGVNDTYGHSAGDELLRTIASRLKSLLRETDTVARIGGDEFCFILSGLAQKEQDALAVAEKIVQELKSPMEIQGRELNVNYSLGVALFPEHGETPEKLISSADKAMYLSKKQGKKSGESHITFF